MRVFIGHDRRELAAYDVCRHSILSRSRAVEITALTLDAVQRAGLYRRGERVVNGQRYDLSDGKPFSTDFSFSRFLVPILTLWQGWALFCDCDFLFLDGLETLWDHRDDRYAVMCVQREHVPSETVKMDGVAQTIYRRKNWSSLVLWNCGHPANRLLKIDDVNKSPGSWLHAFGWLRDEEIGPLPRRWNWLSGVDAPLMFNARPSAVHFTLGTPDMPGCENYPYADAWRRELSLTREHDDGKSQNARLAG